MAKSLADQAVLFVDDEESILNALRRELVDEEFRCFFALSGNQALNIMQKENISVIISDIKMPDMDGLSLLKLVKEKYPTTARVVLSGYTQLPQILVTINQADIFKFLTKPWGSELKPVIQEAINYHQLQEDRIKIEQLLNLQYNDSTNIIKKIENTIQAVRSSHVLFAAMGMKALEMAAEALDSPEGHAMIKEQLMMASSLLKTLSELDFEEYTSISVKSLYEDLSQTLQKGNVKKVESDTETYTKTIRTQQKVLKGFIATIVRNLTDYPHNYTVKIKFRTREAEKSGKHEMTLFISPLDSHNVPEDGYRNQRAYVDMLNNFASKFMALLDGEFIGLITRGTIVLKVVLHECGQ